MDRLTKTVDKNYYIADDTKIQHTESGYTGDAVERLARFENMYGDLISKQDEITKELEKLREEGKTHTVKFRQLFSNKLANSDVITFFEIHGLK